ncbi:hypothetical protein CVT26_001720 [Gymnopilus dilepis]|uniref:F-box domain-containing protein n=1 Tax=Gymnopilus dilepis TaxID=231916 RepID=A0A409VR87_9AGAR|nr:hypothetical protein CVT26_001720 [Gymnopilus dilepis]
MSLFTEFPEELLLHIAGYVAPAAGLGYAPYVTLALTCRRFYVLLATWIAHDQTRLFKQMLSEEAQNAKPRCRVVNSTRVLVTVLDQTTSESNNNWTQNEENEEHTDPDAIPSRSFAFAQDPFIQRIKNLRCIVGGTEKEFQIVLGVISRAPHLQHVHLILVEETSSYRQAARALNVCAAKTRLELTVSGVISDYFERGPFEVRGRQRKRADEAAIPSCSDVDHQRLTKSPRELRKSRSLLAPLSELFSRAREPSKSYIIISVQSRQNPQHPLRGQISYSYKFTPIPPSLRLRLAPHPHLSSFTLRSDSLFYPNLYSLTLHLLNTARIRTLFLASSRMSLHDWGHILQSLTMPELKTLSVGQVAIAFPDLLAFLFRHPSIEKLELGSPDVTGTVKVPHAQGICLLPHLASLTAHREHLVPFIQLKKHGHVPSLRHFSVIVDGFDVLSPLASPEEPFLELLFREVHFEDLSIDFWTLQGYLIFVRWLLCRVRVRLDTTSESKLPSASKHTFELGNLTAVSALVKQWDIGRCLTGWMKDGLDAWAREHASAVELTRGRRKADDGMLDEYSIISESLILSVCPKLENVVYHRV